MGSRSSPHLLAASLGLFLASTPPVSAEVIYAEVGNENDLPIDPPYPVLPLSLGTNSVVGRMSINADAVDAFAVAVPDDLELASVTYVFTSSASIRGDHALTNAVSGFSFATGDGGAGESLAGENVDMIPGLCSVLVTTCGPDSESAVSVPLFDDGLPQGVGVYSIRQTALTVNDPDFVSWSSRYRIDLVVVPEPAAQPCVALAALLARMRRRSRGRTGGAT